MSSADIHGTVLDSTGAVLPGATITLTNVETGVRRETSADSAGAWRFFAAPPGNYEVAAQAHGFIAPPRLFRVTVGGSVDIEIRLRPEGVQEEVWVRGESSAAERDRTQQSDTIVEEWIQNLPINGRSFLDFSLLTAGVTDARGHVAFSLPQAPTSGLSFLGQGGRANSVQVDGVDNNDNSVGAVRSTLSQEAVAEFQINRANYSAEFGRASGGLIHIVSRSGSNRPHGAMFAFVRDEALDARNAFAFGPNGSKTDPPFSRLQTGFTWSGAVRPDRMFFFLSYEGRRQRESRFVTFMERPAFFEPTASQQRVVDALLGNDASRDVGVRLRDALTTSEGTYPYTMRILQASSGVFPFRRTENMASLRLDRFSRSAGAFFGRLAFTDSDTAGDGFGGLKAPSRGMNFKIQDHAFVFGRSDVFGPSIANELRFQFADRRYDVIPADPLGPEISINGIALLGRDFFLPSKRREQRFQMLDNVTVASGRQELKFGGDFHYLPLATATEVFQGGRFIFGEGIPLSAVLENAAGSGAAAALRSARPDLADDLNASITSIQAFNLGLPLMYQQGFGDPRARLTNRLVAGYAQGRLRVGGRVVVNLGLRYDAEIQPPPIHRDTNNWGPRFGFSFSPDKRTVMRGGYGVYYAPIFEAVAFISRVLNGRQISQTLALLSAAPGVPATSADVWRMVQNAGILGARTIRESDIAALGLQPGKTPPVLFGAADRLANPYSQQFSLGIEHEMAGFLVSAGYLGNRGVRVLRSRNVNLRPNGVNAYGPVFAPLDPRILQDNRVESSGSSTYHGLTVSARRQFRGAGLQIAYTLSKTIDDVTDFITDLQPANQHDLRRERGLSSFDQRHRLVASGMWSSRVLSLSSILTISSGHPFNLLLGFDANGDSNPNTDRPPSAGRNTGRGPGFASLDLRLAREFRFSGDGDARIEGILEIFNVANRVNFSGVNNIVGAIPLANYHVEGRRDAAPTEPLGFTSAFDPRQMQVGVRLKF